MQISVLQMVLVENTTTANAGKPYQSTIQCNNVTADMIMIITWVSYEKCSSEAKGSTLYRSTQLQGSS